MDDADNNPLPRMTADQFLDWDGGGHVGKLELVNGEVRAMPVSSATHALIHGSLTGLIGDAIKQQKLKLRTAIRPPIQPADRKNDNVRAPDIAVTAARVSHSFVYDPVLAIEVTEESEDGAASDNMRALAGIPSLMEFVLVDAERANIKVIRRADDGSWPETGEVFETGASVRLESLTATFKIAEIYAGTHLA